MRSRAARLASAALACIMVGATIAFLLVTEQKIARVRATERLFDTRARQAVSRLLEARAGQQAYVATGQSLDAWGPKVAGQLRDAAAAADQLRGLTISADARQSLMDASSDIAELSNIDKRVREYLTTDQALMAGDVVFSEGSDAAASAVRRIESAHASDTLAVDAAERGWRQLEAGALGASVVCVLLILFAMALPAASREMSRDDEADAREARLVESDPATRDTAAPTAAQPERPADAEAITAFSAAANICTQLSRTESFADLKRLLGDAANAMDASGVVVWLGSTTGAALRPVATHGYSDAVIARMRELPRDGNNAASTAYRSGRLQVVAPRADTNVGAVVAPLHCATGCIGALAAEVKGHVGRSETTQAIATIFAAQLAGLLAASADTDSATSSRTATA